MAELEREHHDDFVNYLRMDPTMFHELLERMTTRLTKTDTNCRAALEPGLKQSITLRYLASGDTFHSLSFTFRVPHNTISSFVGGDGYQLPCSIGATPEAGNHSDVPGQWPHLFSKGWPLKEPFFP